jgi:hypothetical protein
MLSSMMLAADATAKTASNSTLGPTIVGGVIGAGGILLVQILQAFVQGKRETRRTSSG